MTENHLIIGLGGTGGKVIRSLRKMTYQTLRTDRPEHVNVRYLYVDSDDSMMALDDPTWKILGHSVQLGRASQLVISGHDLGATLENINQYPGIKPWIGDRDLWRDIVKSSHGAKVNGGQKRRLGRFLFASKIKEFRAMAGRHVTDMTTGGESGVTFHVCCGLAGGTGSGTLIDVIGHIRQMYGGNHNRIILYLLLPEEHPDPLWVGPNYHANGYAALRELNALTLNVYRPYDISTETGLHEGVAKRLDVRDPFNGCYLFSNENEAGYTVGVDKDAPDIMASFLFHKIITLTEVGGEARDNLRRQESFEVNAQGLTAEREMVDGPETRSRRFSAFGIKQIAYPEEEILELLTFSFAQQSALQLRYNHWVDGLGFSQEPRQQSFDGFRDKGQQEKWLLTDEHLTLGVGILEDERKNKTWRPIAQDWTRAVNQFGDLVQNDADTKKEAWITRLVQLCEKRFETDYRKEGIQVFYQNKLQQKQKHAREIRLVIEKDLFAEWENGTQSMHELGQLIEALLLDFGRRAEGFDDRISKYRQIVEESTQQLQQQRNEWSKIGVLGMLLKERQKKLNAVMVTLEHLYAAKTMVIALDFAKRLLADIQNEIGDLKNEVDRAASNLFEAIERFEQSKNARCVDDGMANTDLQVVRFYEPAMVRELTENLVKNEQQQKIQTGAIRNTLVGLIKGDSGGIEPTFARFNERLSLARLLDVFQQKASENALIAHNNLFGSASRVQKLLGVSVIDKLVERYDASNADLKAYVDEIMKKAKVYARFDASQQTSGGPGVPADMKTASTTTIIMPQSDDHGEFVETLKDTFAEFSDGGRPDFAPSNRENEIVILSLTSAFPLRFLSPMKFLREHYEKRLASGEKRAALELHTEGDGSELPRLFQPSEAERGQDAKPYLLLAHGLELLDEETNRAGEIKSRSFKIFDEYGGEVGSVDLGLHLDDAITGDDPLTDAELYELKQLVDKQLRQNSWEPQAVIQRVVSENNAIRGRLKGEAGNGWVEAYQQAIQMVKNA